MWGAWSPSNGSFASNPPPGICSIQVVTHRNSKMCWWTWTIMHELHVLSQSGRYSRHQIENYVLKENKVICPLEAFVQKVRSQLMTSEYLIPDVNAELVLQYRRDIAAGFSDGHICAMYVLTTLSHLKQVSYENKKSGGNLWIIGIRSEGTVPTNDIWESLPRF